MLSFPANYSNALSSPFEENWVVRLYRGSSDYIGIAFGDITMDDSITYHGCILNNPSIRESINLENSKVSTSNISLECSNVNISGTELSQELYPAGSNSYINRDVKIYSVLNDDTAFANALSIYTGRLTEISVTEEGKVKLSIQSKRPWDGVELPNELSTNGVYAPVAYGNYEGNGTGRTTLHRLYPVPLLFASEGGLRFTPSTTIASGYNSAHFWDSSAKSMGGMTFGSSNGATSVHKGVNAFIVSTKLERKHRLIPDYKAGQFSNTSAPTDDDLTTFADSANQTATNTTITKYIEFTFPSLTGKVTALKMHIKADMVYTGNSNSFDQSSVKWCADYDGSDTTDVVIADLTKSPTDNVTATLSSGGSATIDDSGSAHEPVDLMSAVNSNNNALPDSVKIKLIVSAPESITTVGRLKLYDIWFEATVEEDRGTGSGKKTAGNLKKIYIGADGHTKSWDSSVLIQEAHDAHRDLLYRFLGVTDAPEGWSDLDSAKDWKVRFYTDINKPKPILKYLEELSYEGGFIFRFDSTGTPKYNFIANSPSIDMTISHSHIFGLSVTHSDFDSVTTDWTVQYEKNPASSEYASKSTYSDTSTRSTYNYGTFEGKKDIRLKHLVDSVSRTGTNRNDSFLDYYSQLIGTVKQIISFTLADPTKSNLDIGDVIAFSSMSTEKLDGAWHSTNDKFYVTSTSRSVGGQLQVKAREL